MMRESERKAYKKMGIDDEVYNPDFENDPKVREYFIDYSNKTLNDKDSDYLFDYFLSPEVEVVDKGFHKLTDVCTEHKFNFFLSLEVMAKIHLAHQGLFSKIFEIDYLIKNNEDGFENLISYMQSNLIAMLESDELKEREFKQIPKERKQMLLNNSYEVAIKNVSAHLNKVAADKILNRYLNKLHQCGLEDDIRYEKNIFDEVFLKSSISSKINRKKNPHFFSKLNESGIGYEEEIGFYFSGFAEGVEHGYTTKHILISVEDKDKAIVDLGQKMEHLKDFEITQEVQTLITVCQELLKLFASKRYSRYIPFKAVAKNLGMRKSEASNYAKFVLGSLNRDSFKKAYDDLHIYNTLTPTNQN